MTRLIGEASSSLPNCSGRGKGRRQAIPDDGRGLRFAVGRIRVWLRVRDCSVDSLMDRLAA